MSQFSLVTAVDIGADLDRSIEQKKNYESLVQTLQLRTQIEPIITVKTTNKKINGLFAFLSDHDPVWIFCFSVEQVDYFDSSIVDSDLNYIPCILGLGESKKVKTALFMTSGLDKNTVVKSYQLIL